MQLRAIKLLDNVIVLLVGLELIAANVNVLKISTELTAHRVANAKLKTRNFVIPTMENVIANRDGAARHVTVHVPS